MSASDAVPPDAEPVGGERALSSVGWSLSQAAGLVVLTLTLILTVAIALPEGERLAGRAGAPVVRGVALLGVYAVLLAVVWLIARLRGKPFAGAVGLNPIPAGRAIGLGVGFALVARVLAFGWVVVLELLHVPLPDPAKLDVTRALPATPVGVTVTILLAVVIAPLAEEVVFRGVLVDALLQRWREPVALLVSAALFAALHFSLFTLVPVFVLGVGLAWLFVHTRSLWPSIAAHAVFNGVAVIAAYAVRFAA